MTDKMTKRISLSQVVEDLQSGLTRWKKDDIGLGSLEKKYNLTIGEALELFNHPKIKNVESRIPTFIIVDDIPGEETPVVETPVQQPVVETKVEVKEVIAEPVRKAVQQTTVVVKEEVLEEEPVLTPFI